MEKNKFIKNKIKYLQQIILPLILLIYPLRHINEGIDISDTSYNLGNYTTLETLDKMWYFATYLTQEIGGFLNQLPFGNTMMGMNFYTGLFISATALISYFFLCKKIPYGIAFLGEFIAISLCWCPSVILYNYITYLLFTLGAALLYTGLVKSKMKYLIGAGFCLGLNVMTRFPNVVEVTLILALWYYGWMKEKKVLEIAKETGFCILGYLSGLGSVLVVIITQYGFTEYVEGIINLFSMNETATSYTPKEMIMSVVREYIFHIRWILGMIVVVIIGEIGFRIWNRICKNKKYENVPRAIYAVMVLILIRWYYAKGMFNVKYYTYESMKQWVAVFLLISIAVCLWMCITKTTTKEEKLLSSIVLIIIGITPIGSNNYLYPNYNNMFLVAPIVLTLLWNIMRGGNKMTTYCVKIMLVVTIFMFGIQSIGFGMEFIYRDGMQGEKRDTKVENNDILKGMYTTSENAKAIEGLHNYIKEEDLAERQVIVYGNIPGTTYFLGMEPAISSTWPDLPSYQFTVFEEELIRIQNDIKNNRPILIFSKDIEIVLQAEKIEENILDETPEELKEQNIQTENIETILEQANEIVIESKIDIKKLNKIQEMISEKLYYKKYENERFVVYE